jgi:hypothetical protein
MTVEELLRPRYRVAIDYPFSPYQVNQVVDRTDIHALINNVFYEDYPKIFEPIRWYHNRQLHEMPTHLQKLNKDVYEVIKWNKLAVNTWEMVITDGYTTRRVKLTGAYMPCNKPTP